MNDRLNHLPDPAAAPPLAGQPDAALPAGMRLGAFEIQRVISRSASAVVYLATDHALAVQVAIQEYLPARLMRRDAGLRLVATADWHEAVIVRGLRAFVDEARMLARCEHPSLVRVHHLFESHGSAYRVMPVHAGQRLTDLRREMTAPPDEAALRALLDGLLGAIEAIHRSGHVHGGVSAENILLLADDRPLLLGPSAAAREIGSDLVESLMATLESTAGTGQAAEPEAGTPPTGAALDLYRLAEVMRFCIAGEPPASPEALRSREPLARLIARALPAEVRPSYSAALLGALDAAVSPFAEDRPLNVAQFRDWLARGVPAVPGRGAARPAVAFAVAAPSTAPAVSAAAPATAPSAATPRPTPTPAPDLAPHPVPVAPGAPEIDRALAPETARESAEPLAPWPDVVRAIDPPFGPGVDSEPAPLPPQLQRLTRSRLRRYQWMMGAALALLAAAVLVVVTGVWNRAPEISLGPRVVTAPPAAAIPHDTPVAETPPAPRRAAELPDPARTLAAEPPKAGPAASTPPIAAPTSPTAPTAPPEPPEPIATATPPEPPAPIATTSPPTRPTRPAPTAHAAAAASPGPSPRAACAGRTEFALYRCMQQQCEAKRWATHPQCLRLRREDRVD